MARDRLNLSMQVLPPGDLPAPRPKPFFALLDRALSDEIRRQVQRPFWIDTVGQSRHVEIRVKLQNAILRFVATRSQTYASNSHIFLLWMIGSSVILLTVAILFLRNQIRPILRLAEAADAFGKGRKVPDDFRPRGAREVRQAATAFLEMRDRITTHVEQRTTMLAGVSHDLRTILTRFKLELALLGDTPEAQSLQADVREMQDMLEDYLAFAKGDGGEESAPDQPARAAGGGARGGADTTATPIELKLRKRREELVLPLKRQAFKRAITNLVSNAARFGDQIIIRGAVEGQWVRIEVDDNGPGIPPVRARQRVQAVLPARPRAQPGRRQHRPWSRHRARHRQEPRRRHHAGRKLDGRPARHHLRAAVSPALGKGTGRDGGGGIGRRIRIRAGLGPRALARHVGALVGEAADLRYRIVDRLQCSLAAPQTPVERRHGAGEARIVVAEPGAIDGGVDRAEPGSAQLPLEAFAADAGGAQHPRLRLTQCAHDRGIRRPQRRRSTSKPACKATARRSGS